MALTTEQREIGKQNYQDAVDTAGVTRRAFLKGTAAAGTAGAFYFSYQTVAGKPVKVGIIGTGDEGSVLITQLPPEYMDVVAIADLRPTNRKRAFTGDNNEHRIGLVKKLGQAKCDTIKVYNDHKELLADPAIEAVIIAVPLNQHAAVSIDAMKAGKHVLCEKLMAHNITQCKEMIKVSKETGKLLAVGHQRHYSVLYANCNDLIHQGVLGDIRFIRACWHRNNSWPGQDSWNKPVPKEDKEFLDKVVGSEPLVKNYGYDSTEQLCKWRLFNKTGGGLMAELGSHQLDACSIFLGKVKPLSVQGYGGKNFYGVLGVGTKEQQADEREIDDQVFIIVEFPGPNYDAKTNKDDIVVVTYSSINTNASEPYGETVFGSRGTMIVEKEQTVMLTKEGGGNTGDGGPGQRLVVLNSSDGKAVLQASASLAPAKSVAVADQGVVSRGYTEEMEHFAWCIRNDIKWDTPIDKGGLRCPGKTAMADAIMALTSNLAMNHKIRINFKPEWFDPDSPAVPEDDEQIKAHPLV